MGTGLDKKEHRSKSGWPECASFPGMWVARRKAPVRSTSTFLLQSISFQPIVRTLQDLGPASLLCSLPATGCTTCNVALPSESGLTMHEEGEQHRRNLEFAKLLQVVAVEKK